MIRPTGFNIETSSATQLTAYYEEHERVFKSTQSDILTRERRARETDDGARNFEVSAAKLGTEIAEMEAVTKEVARRLQLGEPSFLWIPQNYWPTIFWGGSVAFPVTSYISKYTVNPDFVYNDIGYGLGVVFASLSLWASKKESAFKEERAIYQQLLQKTTTIESGKTIAAFLQRDASLGEIDSSTLTEASFRALCEQIVTCDHKGARDYAASNMRERVGRMSDESQKARFLRIFKEYVDVREASVHASQRASHPLHVVTNHAAHGSSIAIGTTHLHALPRHGSSEEIPAVFDQSRPGGGLGLLSTSKLREVVVNME
jgi:hypothetical protein